MGDQVMLLVVGSVLTTGLGGFLGYWFQRRAWSHQFEVQRTAQEREAAWSALSELAALLDKRRYRMMLVHWRLDRSDPGDLEDALSAYRGVLEEWNDGLNRRLALIATHFGADLKRELELLYETYRDAGRLLEVAVRERREGADPSDRSRVVELLEELNQRNYAFTETGLSLILTGHVGSHLTPDQRSAERTGGG